MKNFIESDNGVEYIIFEPLFCPEQESKKLDIGTGGEDEIYTENIPDLETEDDAAEAMLRLSKKKEPPKDAKTGSGLMMTRLPILLAQKQAGNNSQKLNNEIRKIIYSF